MKYFYMWYERVFGHHCYMRRYNFQYMGELPLNTSFNPTGMICVAEKRIPKSYEDRQKLVNELVLDPGGSTVKKFLTKRECIPSKYPELMYKYSLNENLLNMGNRITVIAGTSGEFGVNGDSNFYLFETSFRCGDVVTNIGLRDVDPEGYVRLIYRENVILPPTKVSDFRYDNVANVFWLFDNYLQIPIVARTGNPGGDKITLEYEGNCLNTETSAVCIKYAYIPRTQRSKPYRGYSYIYYIDRRGERPVLNTIPYYVN